MLLILKLILTPLFIAAVTLAGRKWGPAVGGLLMGLPLTSGPTSFFLSQEYGAAFASKATSGNLIGQASVCVFCLAYTLAAQKFRWQASAAIGLGAFFAALLVCELFSWPLLAACALLMGVIALVSRFIPRYAEVGGVFHAPGWDLPARMLIATTIVISLTAVANLLGPQLSGLISSFPIFAVILTAFAHHQQGKQAATRMLRSMVIGSISLAFFYLVVGSLLMALGPVTYLLAAAVAVGINALIYVITRRAAR